MQETNRLYTDLAWLWPLWGGAAAEYADYSEHVIALIRQYSEREVRTLLDIGCGGGKNVYNLKRSFNVTGLDLSPTMLAQAKELNPECTFVHGDMRSFSLNRSFDAVLMDDAIAHMNNRVDFEEAFRAAYAHLNPGGVMVVTPDVTVENFQQNKTTTFSATKDGLDVVFIENVYDSDTSDEQYETTILYLIREQGSLRIETDHWVMGIFTLDTWRQVLHETGFQTHEKQYRLGEDEYTVFVCVKPQ
ncbi:class I SAM-dependent methyltransferase [Desulfobulbus alkaliphilus]|uniref:class I SAM-dependent methyltransferase n=1 Tax=Desulfobulbus alkaliphilus TaxID=869814 RepID=UPI0019653624|nr:class I SAM-dependent methyltransferase [Desulfobulbus alkaliphilus]MBM9537540.1 class I SAM-dependent methyltransferase [Desulfobulbus alkaliphilus]